MIKILELLVVLLFVIGTTALFASSLYEVVANWFNFRGAFFKRRLTDFLQELDAHDGVSFRMDQQAGVMNRIQRSSVELSAEQEVQQTRLFRRNRFPAQITSQALASYASIPKREYEKFDVLYTQFEKELTSAYKAQVKRYLFIPGMLLALLFHVDLFDIATYMYNEDGIRKEAVASIVSKLDSLSTQSNHSGEPTKTDTLKKEVLQVMNNYVATMETHGIPLGWTNQQYLEWETDVEALKSLMLIQTNDLFLPPSQCDASSWSKNNVLKWSGHTGSSDNAQVDQAAESIVATIHQYQIEWNSNYLATDEINQQLDELITDTEPKKHKAFTWLFLFNSVFLGLCAMMGGPYWFDLIGKIVKR